MKYGDRDMEKISLSAELNEYTSGHVALQIEGSEDGDPGFLSASPDWSDPRQILMKDVQLQVSAELLEMLLNIAEVQVNEVEVPDLVRVNGEFRLTPGNAGGFFLVSHGGNRAAARDPDGFPGGGKAPGGDHYLPYRRVFPGSPAPGNRALYP